MSRVKTPLTPSCSWFWCLVSRPEERNQETINPTSGLRFVAPSLLPQPQLTISPQNQPTTDSIAEGANKKAVVLTEAEKIQRREENARRRKRQTEQRQQDEQVCHFLFYSSSSRFIPLSGLDHLILISSASPDVGSYHVGDTSILGRAISREQDTRIGGLDCPRDSENLYLARGSGHC